MSTAASKPWPVSEDPLTAPTSRVASGLPTTSAEMPEMKAAWYWREFGEPVVDMFRVMSYREMDMISMDPVDPLGAYTHVEMLRDLTPEAIDTVMKLGMKHPMGPLTLADFIGLDTCVAILEVMHKGLGDPKYRPGPLLRKYVAAGWLGRKSGRGFYSYGS